MSTAPEYIKAKPLCERYVAVDPLGIYHGRFAGFATEAHQHGDPQLLIPLAGRMHLKVGERDYLVGPEWAGLLLPDTPHGFTHLDGALEFLSITFPVDRFREWAIALKTPLPEAPGALVVQDPGLWLQGRQVARELELDTPASHRILRAGVEQLGLYVLRAASVTVDPARAHSPVLRAVERMMRDFAEPLTLGKLAGDCAMSPRHFERRFKEVLGQTPKQFLIDLRLSAARDRLANTDWPIGEIGRRVGFSNPSHFTATFQRVLRRTPAAYRAQERARKATEA